MYAIDVEIKLPFGLSNYVSGHNEAPVSIGMIDTTIS